MVKSLYQGRVSCTVQCGPIRSQCISLMTKSRECETAVSQSRRKWGPGVQVKFILPLSFVRRTLGIDELKPEQHQAITAFLFVSLPTGFEMTLCFAALPGTFDGLKGETKTSVVVMY